MSKAEHKYKIKNSVTDHIKALLMGPVAGEEEIIRINRFSLLYLTGILYAKNSSKNSEAKKTSDSEENNAIDDAKKTNDFQGTEGALELAYSNLPSSIGLSFLVSKNSIIEIDCKAGFYISYKDREYTYTVVNAVSLCTYSIEIDNIKVSYKSETKNKKVIRDGLFELLSFEFKNKKSKNYDEKLIFEKIQKDQISIISKKDTLDFKALDDFNNKNSKFEVSNFWKRKPLLLDKVEKFNTVKDSQKNIFDGKASIRTKVRDRKNNCLITVSLVNEQKANENIDTEKNLYQAELSCKIKEGSLLEYDKPDPLNLNEEEKINEIQFSDKPIYAIAHGTSCNWDENKQIVYTEYIPESKVYRPLFDDLVIGEEKFKNPEVFNIYFLADKNNYEEKIPNLLKALCDFYKKWLDTISNKTDSLLDEKLSDTKNKIIEKGFNCLERMRRSCELITNNNNVKDAFIFANKAMFKQATVSKAVAIQRQDRLKNENQWPIPFEEENSLDIDNEIEKKNTKWRPFQLAFALMVIESLETKENSNLDEDILDLIWFSTGGGKTEAYLLVAAYEIFRRRLEWKEFGAGTSVITRYTYRFLTADQFIRTSRLICAMEEIRALNKDKFGSEKISLGLYVGGELTPNRLRANQEGKDAIDIYDNIINSEDPKVDGSKFQITECPYCGTELLPNRKPESGETNLNAGYGFKVDETSMEIACPNKKCFFYGENGGLPLCIVDEVIYDKRPTFLIGTIDKFANLCWNESASNIFGLENHGNRSEQIYAPPSLIIQDELHLISGALGTVAGVYEAGIDSLITKLFKKANLNRKVKYIASTATIKAVENQALRLSARKVEIFPPRGLKSSDAFYFREDLNDKYARTYIGVMPQSNTSATVGAYYTAAAILESVDYIRNKKLDGKKSEIDFLWTLLCYCNSKRELGLITKAASDEITNRMSVYRDLFLNDYDHPERDIASSKLEISADAIKNVMDARDSLSTEGKYSIAPCTNMISVGIDIDRLGLMMVYGQPKSTSEYIQATSRVGRNPDKYGSGLVVTYYSPSKPRDRSHYEQFIQYHSTFNKFIEPTSITPGSKAALDRALHASMITYIRLLNSNSNILQNSQAKNFKKENFIDDLNFFKSRILKTYTMEYQYEKDQIQKSIMTFVDNWEKWAADSDIKLSYRSQDRKNNALMKMFNSKKDSIGYPTMTSMRNVDMALDVNINHSEKNEN